MLGNSSIVIIKSGGMLFQKNSYEGLKKMFQSNTNSTLKMTSAHGIQGNIYIREQAFQKFYMFVSFITMTCLA